jgi:hypothetical protein
VGANLTAAVAGGRVIDIAGRFQRHCAARRRDTALDGHAGYGRWGRADGFPVLYLGRPTASVVAEAYRHLIDPIADPAARAALARNLAPRILVTVDVRVTRILDLRDRPTRDSLGLTGEILSCGTDDRAGYAACQHVSHGAYRAGLHGLIAPAATGLGETLVLFTDRLPRPDQPHIASPDVMWPQLPADPRL